MNPLLEFTTLTREDVKYMTLEETAAWTKFAELCQTMKEAQNITAELSSLEILKQKLLKDVR